MTGNEEGRQEAEETEEPEAPRRQPEIDPAEEPSIGHSGGEVETGWDEKAPSPGKK